MEKVLPPPSSCDLCKMDWKNGACGDCTMTREQLDHVAALDLRIVELEAAITKTLNENGHLADGEDCTLIDLKRAMPTWELADES